MSMPNLNNSMISYLWEQHIGESALAGQIFGMLIGILLVIVKVFKEN